MWISTKPGAATIPLVFDKVNLSNEIGIALQAGVDIAINDKGLGVTLYAKKYFVSTKSRWFVGGTEVIGTKHKLDPWVLSAGLSYRF